MSVAIFWKPHIVASFLLLLVLRHHSFVHGFCPHQGLIQHVPNDYESTTRIRRSLKKQTVVPLHMGLFDGLSKAFTNQDFQSQDRRVRASHILVKFEDDTMDEAFLQIQSLLQTLQQTSGTAAEELFADLARNESACASALKGGDLGWFGPGVMARELDDVLFDNDDDDDVGSILGPIVTDFGMHLVLVTARETNRDQVEEKLARND